MKKFHLCRAFLAPALLMSSSVLGFPAASEGRAGGNGSQGAAPPSNNLPEAEAMPPVIVVGERPITPPTLETVTGTGSRLGLTARELPASVTILDHDTLQRLGARSTREAVEFAPGMTSAEPPSTPSVFSSRGFAGNDIVQLYDGIAIGAPSMTAWTEDVWKYERAEVLKGPASVLYGEGAIAGAINYVFKQPNPERSQYEVFGSYGSFNTARAAAGAGGPLGKSGLSYRLDYSQQTADSFIDRAGRQYYDVAGALRYDVSEQLTLTLSFDLVWQDQDAYFGTPLIGGDVDHRTRELNYNVADARTDQDSQLLRLRADWTPSDQLTVRNLLYGFLADRAWRNVERYTYVAATDLIRRTSATEILHDQKLIGDRLDAVVEHDLLGRENRFLAGIEAFRDDFQRDSNRPDNGNDTVDPFVPVPGRFDDLRTVATSPERRTVTDTGALFIEDRWRVFEPFSLVGGLRGEIIEVNSENLRVSPASRFNKQFTPLTGRIGGVLDATTNLSFYAQYCTAAKPTTALVVFDEANRNFQLERGEMVEVGLKHSLWENRLEWTLACYQISKNDTVTRDPVNPTQSIQIGAQSSHGIELSLAALPTADWSVGGNLAVLEAQYDTFNVVAGTTAISYEGNTPPNVPEVVANLWTAYRLPWNFTLGASARYIHEVQANNANTLQLPAYVTLDLFATYRYRQAEFTLRARNVLDEEYSAWSVGDGAQVLLGTPLAIEGSILIRF
jgi:iron complex outermembrane receptor protein